jgi:hypothetical protein
MRRVAYAMIASSALAIGALSSGSALANCHGGGCDDGYRSGPHRPAAVSHQKVHRYSKRPVFRSWHSDRSIHHKRPRYRTAYDQRPAYRVGHHKSGYRQRPAHRVSQYHSGYRQRPAYRVRHFDAGHYHQRPAYRTGYYYRGYDGGYGELPRYLRHHQHHSYLPHHGSYYPTVSYGGIGSGARFDKEIWLACRTVYIPHGWGWYQAMSC